MTRRFLLPFCALLCLTACTAGFGMAPTLDTDLVEPGTVSAVQAAIEEADLLRRPISRRIRPGWPKICGCRSI